MALEFVDLHRGGASKYSWIPPFDRTVDYENEHWWDRTSPYGDSPWYVQVLEDDVEVARVELDDPGGINPEAAVSARKWCAPSRSGTPIGDCSRTARRRTGSGPRWGGTGSIIRKGRSSTDRCSSSRRGRKPQDPAVVSHLRHTGHKRLTEHVGT